MIWKRLYIWEQSVVIGNCHTLPKTNLWEKRQEVFCLVRSPARTIIRPLLWKGYCFYLHTTYFLSAFEKENIRLAWEALWGRRLAVFLLSETREQSRTTMTKARAPNVIVCQTGGYKPDIYGRLIRWTALYPVPVITTLCVCYESHCDCYASHVFNKFKRQVKAILVPSDCELYTFYSCTSYIPRSLLHMWKW